MNEERIFFSWKEVHINIEQIDWNIYPHSIKIAKEDFMNKAKPCPGCGKNPNELFWLGIQSANEKWDKGEGKAGFLTICKKCNIQVDFFRDLDLEKVIREGGVKL